MPFEDRAGFQGNWQLSTDISKLLSANLSSVTGIEIIEVDLDESVASRSRDYSVLDSVASGVKADFFLTGIIDVSQKSKNLMDQRMMLTVVTDYSVYHFSDKTRIRKCYP